MDSKGKYIQIILSMVIFILLMGCCGHTNSSKFAYYPSGTIYNDAQYSLIINMRGAGCKAYADLTQKEIYLKLQKKDGSTLLERRYTVEAGNLNCYWQWEKEKELTVVFFDYGGNNIISQSGRPIPDLRQILLVNVDGVSTKENYVLGNVPEWLKTAFHKYYE